MFGARPEINLLQHDVALLAFSVRNWKASSSSVNPLPSYCDVFTAAICGCAEFVPTMIGAAFYPHLPVNQPE